MAKKAAIILSSPRKGSNSNALAMSVEEGLRQQGVETNVLDLSGLEIKPCIACEYCQRNGGKCIQMDGMQAVYPQVVAADILVMASPIYWFNMSAQLKLFIDRCFAVALSEKGPFSQKTIAAAFAFGDVDVFHSGAVNAIRSLQDMCSYTKAAWGGCVYGMAMERDAMKEKKELLEEAKALGAALA